MSEHTIDIVAMLEFYDADDTAKKHSNAVKTMAHEEFAIALFCYYLTAGGTNGNKANRLDGSCLPLTNNKGKRLDAWIRVEEAGKPLIFYQTEVKASSYHGYRSGKALDSKANGPKLKAHMAKAFGACWDTHKGRFKDPGLDKVLHKMRLDELPETERRSKVLPLACLWAPMHPEWDMKNSRPFFEVPNVSKLAAEPSEASESPFESVWIFSASACLRQYLDSGVQKIELGLPKFAETRRRLQAIYG